MQTLSATQFEVQQICGDSVERSHTSSYQKAGIVIIGRNVGRWLEGCLRSILPSGLPVVYVDSGSADGSVAIANSLGANLVELDRSQPFTAALARNAGWRRLMEHAPQTEFIQFVDGDCEIVIGWLESATSFVDTHSDVAVVCGRRREIEPKRNRYHRLADMEWDTPVGEADYCGGDALIRVSAFRQVGGYRDALVAGEEPELCVRLRKAGWKVWRIDHDMTRHDIDMNSFGQWWKRSIRGGHAYAEGADLHGASPTRHWLKETRSIWIWGIAFPAISLLLIWFTKGLSLVALLAIYLILFVKIVRSRMINERHSLSDASLYAFFCVVGKWPQAIGVIKYFLAKRTGRRVSLIEYDRSSSTK
jgi:GT2 family glycosyltransferase